jgi:hypothetical protein
MGTYKRALRIARENSKPTAMERIGLLIGCGGLGATVLGQVYFVARLL